MKPLVVLAAVMSFALATPVMAQTASDQQTQQGTQAPAKPGPKGPRRGMAPAGPMQGQPMQGGMMHGGMMHGMMMGPGKHLEGRLAFVRAELAITEAQTPAWNAFADAVRKATKDMMASMPMIHANAADAGWLANLERHEKMMASHLDGLRAIRAAAQPLYAALSDEQKKNADELLSGPMGPMGGMGHDMHRGMGRPMGPMMRQ